MLVYLIESMRCASIHISDHGALELSLGYISTCVCGSVPLFLLPVGSKVRWKCVLYLTLINL